ncbi:MAG TPA: DUF2975 domain-containing protein [Gemmatimonadaceae bacterium]|nr:DUF2975 domain-containing protein [Gemmatimonadaceae bacterium]
MIRTVATVYSDGAAVPMVAVPPVDPLSFSRRLLRILVGLNLLMGAGIVGLLVTSFVAGPWLIHALGVRPALKHSTLDVAARLIMLVGIAATPLTHVVLTRLQAIVEMVRRRNPFISENAARLRTVAWAVVGLELLHLTAGLIAHTVPSPEETLDLNWSFSITRWLCVLLLFVLARVFEHGVAMREDVEGTV